MTTSSKTALKRKPAPATDPARGRVQRLYRERGFGFLRCTEGLVDDVGQDFFFHTTSLDGGLSIDDLEEGEIVSFTPTHVAKGRRAEHIVREEGL